MTIIISGIDKNNSGQLNKQYNEITQNKELSPINGKLLKIPKGY